MDNIEPQDKLSSLIWLILVVIVLWLSSWLFTDYIISCSPAIRGQFGDKFGFVNSLFSGLALAGIIYSILLQKKELSLQRWELKETRQEFAQQNFESTFFNLLKNQQQITNTIKATITYLKRPLKFGQAFPEGREFFRYSKRELLKIYRALKSPKFGYYDQEYYNSFPEEDSGFDIDYKSLTAEAKIEFTNDYYQITEVQWEKAKTLDAIRLGKLSYHLFSKRYHYVFSHYFRNFYHILKFLEDSEIHELGNTPNEKLKVKVKEKYLVYSQFVQAQMSAPEMFLLFYHLLTFPPLKQLVVKYNILENFAKEDLIDIEHNNLDGITLRSREIIID